jgi:hypothetical protein
MPIKLINKSEIVFFMKWSFRSCETKGEDFRLLT